MDNLVWNVFYHDINRNEIRIFNVFQHGGFREDIQKHFKKYKERDVFAEELRRSLFYYFCSKCEWEVIIAPWCGGKGTEDIKVDVYWQVMNNWEIFLDYVWNSKRKK